MFLDQSPVKINNCRDYTQTSVKCFLREILGIPVLLVLTDYHLNESRICWDSNIPTHEVPAEYLLVLLCQLVTQKIILNWHLDLQGLVTDLSWNCYVFMLVADTERWTYRRITSAIKYAVLFCWFWHKIFVTTLISNNLPVRRIWISILTDNAINNTFCHRASSWKTSSYDATA